MSPALVAATAAPGWYGKLPCAGDFAGRRLPPAFVQRWDPWLQRALLCSREQLGPQWLDAYLVAPILRFWLAPGLAGERGWAGLLMPSVDRVGRHFPLTIAHTEDGLANALSALAWYAALDELARAVLDVAFTIEALEEGLAAIGPLVPQTAAAVLASRVPPGGHAPGASVWWTGDADRAGGFACFDALPPPAAWGPMMQGAAS